MKLIREFCKVPEGINAVYDILGGAEPSRAILDYARQKDADLIVMGSRSKESEEKERLGNTAEQVSAQSFCPVIIVTHPHAGSKTE